MASVTFGGSFYFKLHSRDYERSWLENISGKWVKIVLLAFKSEDLHSRILNSIRFPYIVEKVYIRIDLG